MRIILDLDDVLCDFIGGVCAEYLLTREELYKHWQPGVWNCVPPLNAARRMKLTDAGFHTTLEGREEFWANLKPLPWTAQLLGRVQSFTDDWHIVTSPTYCTSCYNGKVRWLKNYFGPTFNRFAITPHKYIFAKPGVVLIDDSDTNIQAFAADEGHGIIFPAHQNSRHYLAHNPLEYVEQCLGYIVSSGKMTSIHCTTLAAAASRPSAG